MKAGALVACLFLATGALAQETQASLRAALSATQAAGYRARETEDWAKALQLFSEARERARALNDIKEEARCLALLAETERLKNDPLRALAYYQQLQAFALENQLFGMAATGYLGQAILVRQQGQKERARQLLQEGQRTQEKEPDSARRADYLIAAAFEYVALDDHQKAGELLEDAERLARAAGDTKATTTALSSQAFLYRKRQQYDKAIAALEASLPLSRARGDWVRELIDLQDIVHIHKEKGTQSQAEPYIAQALALAKQHEYGTTQGDRRQVLRLIADASQHYLLLGNDARALETRELEERLARGQSAQRARMEALRSVANRARERNEGAQALLYLNEALALAQQLNDHRQAAWFLFVLGDTAKGNQEYPRALAYFQQFQAMVPPLGMPQMQVNSYPQRAEIYLRQGDRARAVQALKDGVAQQSLLQEKGERGRFLLVCAALYARLNESRAAHALLTQAGPLLSQIGDPTQRHEFLQKQIEVALLLEENALALDYLVQSERLSRERGNPKDVAQAVILQGDLYQKRKQFPQALACWLAALPLLRALDDWQQEMIQARNIALLYSELGEPEKGIPYLEGALQLARSQEKKHTDGSRRLVAQLQGSLSTIYQEVGAFDRALPLLQAALQQAEKTDLPLAQAEAHKNLAGFYERWGDLPRALAHYPKAALAFGLANDTVAQTWQVTRQANLLARRGRQTEALACYQRALLLAQKQKSTPLEGTIYLEIGLVYGGRGELEQARRWCEKSVQIRRRANDPEGLVYTLKYLGEVCEGLNQFTAARRYFAEAQLLYQRLGDRTGEVGLLTQLAHLEIRARQSSAAATAYRSAIALVEQLRTDTGAGMSAQGAFFARLSTPYAGYLTLLVEQGRASEAFTLAQKTKARGLLDLMALGKLDLSHVLTETERAEEQKRKARCAQLARVMVAEAARNIPGSKKRFAAAKHELAVAERELALFQDQLYATHPGLGKRRATTTASVTQLARALPRDAALLEFSLLETGQVAVFVLTRDRAGKGTVTVHTTTLPPTERNRCISALRTACTDPRRPWKSDARRLYQVLLAPVERYFARKTQLILCPDRSLWDVPFAVLTDRRGTPLLARFSLSYAGSATTWHATQGEAHPSARSPQLLVLANPQFDAERRFESSPAVPGQRPLTAPNRPITAPNRPITAPNRALLLPRGTRLVDLPGTQREADALAKRFPRAAIYTRAQAQESVVKATAGQFQRIHLASHAFVNDAAPLLSSVVLANPGPQSTDDGFLTAREIFDLDLSGVELVVLSACNTARGQVKAGEGVIGLTWALFAAGCPTQVLSQWAVDDTSTATLMTRFYDGLAKGIGKSAALRQAALHIRRAPTHGHPYYWAPFVLVGDPR